MSSEDSDSGEHNPSTGSRQQNGRPLRSETSARTRFAEKVGVRIRKRRIALGLRQEDVMRRMSHPADEVRGANRRHTLSQYERGKAMPSLEIIVSLAQALETGPEWLAFGLSAKASSSKAVTKDSLGRDSGAAWALDAEFRRMIGARDHSVLASFYSSSFKPGIIGDHDMALVETGVAIGDRPQAAILSGPVGAVFGIAIEREGKTMVSQDGVDWADAGPQNGEFLGVLLGVFAWRSASA